MSARRFFSGRTLEQAVMEAARHHDCEPEEVSYRLRDRQGAVKSRAKVVIEVDPEAPDQRDPEADAVLESVELVLNVLNLDVHASLVAGEDDTIEVNVDGPDRELVWGRNAEVLEAVETLAGVVIRGRVGRVTWRLDVDGRRRAGDAELRRRALEVAARVRESGEAEDLGAQSPAERRIVHMTLKEVEGVATYSEGEGAERRVVVDLATDSESGD